MSTSATTGNPIPGIRRAIEKMYKRGLLPNYWRGVVNRTPQEEWDQVVEHIEAKEAENWRRFRMIKWRERHGVA